MIVFIRHLKQSTCSNKSKENSIIEVHAIGGLHENGL